MELPTLFPLWSITLASFWNSEIFVLANLSRILKIILIYANLLADILNITYEYCFTFDRALKIWPWWQWQSELKITSFIYSELSKHHIGTKMTLKVKVQCFFLRDVNSVSIWWSGESLHFWKNKIHILFLNIWTDHKIMTYLQDIQEEMFSL